MLFDPNRLVRPSELKEIDSTTYDDLPVTEARTKITRAGDGLSEALRLAPVHVPIGAQVVILMIAEATAHQHARRKEGRGADAVELDEYVETATLEARAATFIDPDLVSDVLSLHMQRVEEARARAEAEKREAAGEFSLFDLDADLDADE